MTATRILLADADASGRTFCRAALCGRGFEVEVADDGLDCLVKMRAFRPQVLLLDPGILWGGDGVLARMREDADLRAVPVIVLSRPGDSGAAGAHFFPVHAHFVKPPDAGLLAESIRRLVRNAGGRPADGLPDAAPAGEGWQPA